LNSCTKKTKAATGLWLGEGEKCTIVDTPGFGDSDNEDGVLIDEMMNVLNQNVVSANVILLLLKGTETRLGGELQQMIREMRALFGEQMWDNLVIGVSFWTYKAADVNYRNITCQYSPPNCHDEKWFMKSMKSILTDKFHITQDIPFVFIDSWAKHPVNAEDLTQKEKFESETEKLWTFAKEAKPFDFFTVNDVLAENHIVKKRNAELEEIIKNDISYLKDSNDEQANKLNVIMSELEKVTKKTSNNDEKIKENLKICEENSRNNEEKINENSRIYEKKINENSRISEEKIKENSRINEEKINENSRIYEEKIKENVKMIEGNLIDLEKKIFNVIPNDLIQQLTEMKVISLNIEKDLDAEIQERKQFNGGFIKDISQLQSKSNVTDIEVACIKNTNVEQKSSITNLETSISTTKTKLEKSISATKTKLEKTISTTKTNLEASISTTKTNLEKDISQLQSKSTAIDIKVASIKNTNDEQKSSLTNLKTSISTTKTKLEKSNSNLQTRLYNGKIALTCDDNATDYANSMWGSFTFRCDQGKLMYEVSSYHDNFYEDRKFRFKCCSLKYVF